MWFRFLALSPLCIHVFFLDSMCLPIFVPIFFLFFWRCANEQISWMSQRALTLFHSPRRVIAYVYWWQCFGAGVLYGKNRSIYEFLYQLKRCLWSKWTYIFLCGACAVLGECWLSPSLNIIVVWIWETRIIRLTIALLVVACTYIIILSNVSAHVSQAQNSTPKPIFISLLDSNHFYFGGGVKCVPCACSIRARLVFSLRV